MSRSRPARVRLVSVSAEVRLGPSGLLSTLIITEEDTWQAAVLAVIASGLVGLGDTLWVLAHRVAKTKPVDLPFSSSVGSLCKQPMPDYAEARGSMFDPL